MARAQKAAFKAGEAAPPYPSISDDEIRETIEANQLRLIKERGADMTIFAPVPAPWRIMSATRAWPKAGRSMQQSDRPRGRAVPETFTGVCMLPQNPQSDLTSSIAELAAA
jgi:4-oxalmesaconate hydratase